MAVTRMSELVGRVLSGRYRLIAPIGAGASAQVLLADDTRLRRRVAVKLLHAGLADDEGFLRRFRAEAQAAAALNHPNIVAVYDWGEDDGTPYLVTEYLAGGSLRGVLDLGRRLTPSQALLVGLEATRALEHAHRRGFVHRDIKPANLLFGDEGRLRIADFGLARALAEAAWTEPAGAVVGTARYASPEQARGESVDGRADVYALALVLIEAVTGRVPFAADTTIATLMARVDRAIEVPSELGPLRRVLVRAGQPHPADRPDAGEFAVGLMAAAEELPRPTPLPLAGAVAEGAAPADDRDATMLPPTAAARATADDTIVAPGVAASLDETSTETFALEPDDDGETGRRRRWPAALVALLLIAALGVGGVLASQTLLVPSHEVPELVGADRAEAEAAADANDWDLDVREDRDDSSTPGEVLRQDPAPGEELKEGDTLVVVVSIGRELRTVPADLVGKPLPDALAALDAAGLVGVEAERVFHEDVPADTVVALAEGTPPELETGSEVVLVVSKGPEPRTVPPSEGQAPDAVCAALDAVQLACEQVPVFHDTVPAGEVVGTEPGAGEQAPRGDTVRVLVSQGPELIAIPDVSGNSVADAAAALRAAGFTVAGVSGDPERTVRGTNPPAGERHRRGTSVTLITRG